MSYNEPDGPVITDDPRSPDFQDTQQERDHKRQVDRRRQRRKLGLYMSEDEVDDYDEC